MEERKKSRETLQRELWEVEEQQRETYALKKKIEASLDRFMHSCQVLRCFLEEMQYKYSGTSLSGALTLETENVDLIYRMSIAAKDEADEELHQRELELQEREENCCKRMREIEKETENKSE